MPPPLPSQLAPSKPEKLVDMKKTYAVWGNGIQIRCLLLLLHVQLLKKWGVRCEGIGSDAPEPAAIVEVS